MIDLELHQPLRRTLRLAFRTAFRDTFDALVAEHSDTATTLPGSHGFLSELPLISGCAPQIQLELLLNTWRQIDAGELDGLMPLQHCVIYCAFGCLARHAELEHLPRLQQAAETESPRDVNATWLASTARTFQVIWPLDTDDTPIIAESLLGEERLDRIVERPETDTLLRRSLLMELSRWAADPAMLSDAASLLTESEIAELGNFLLEHPRLLKR